MSETFVQPGCPATQGVASGNVGSVTVGSGSRPRSKVSAPDVVPATVVAAVLPKSGRLRSGKGLPTYEVRPVCAVVPTDREPKLGRAKSGPAAPVLSTLSTIAHAAFILSSEATLAASAAYSALLLAAPSATASRCLSSSKLVACPLVPPVVGELVCARNFANSYSTKRSVE